MLREQSIIDVSSDTAKWSSCFQTQAQRIEGFRVQHLSQEKPETPNSYMVPAHILTVLPGVVGI